MLSILNVDRVKRSLDNIQQIFYSAANKYNLCFNIANELGNTVDSIGPTILVFSNNINNHLENYNKIQHNIQNINNNTQDNDVIDDSQLD